MVRRLPAGLKEAFPSSRQRSFSEPWNREAEASLSGIEPIRCGQATGWASREEKETLQAWATKIPKGAISTVTKVMGLLLKELMGLGS